MRILIYIGYQKPHFNAEVWLDNGAGGTEYCAMKLAEVFSSNDHEVIVSGNVKNGYWNGVRYVALEDLNRSSLLIASDDSKDLKPSTHYDIVIASQYIHYFKELEQRDITFNYSLFWLHNEDGWYPYYRGEKIHDNGVSYLFKDNLNGIVGVSHFHSNLLKNILKNISNKERDFNELIYSIDNAIDPKDWDSMTINKVKGRIIWSSSPDRGLHFILENWKRWKEIRPDLTLHICCPPYSKDWEKGFINQEGIKYLGALNPSQLRIEQCNAEYWIYSSEYVETYCITALEIMMSKCKIITNGPGNIKHLIESGRYGTLVDNSPESVIQILSKDLLDDDYSNLLERKVILAYEFALKQNWDQRINEWLSLIGYIDNNLIKKE